MKLHAEAAQSTLHRRDVAAREPHRAAASGIEQVLGAIEIARIEPHGRGVRVGQWLTGRVQGHEEDMNQDHVDARRIEAVHRSVGVGQTGLAGKQDAQHVADRLVLPEHDVDPLQVIARVVTDRHHEGRDAVAPQPLTEGLCAMSVKVPGLEGYRDDARGFLNGQLDMMLLLGAILDEARRLERGRGRAGVEPGPLCASRRGPHQLSTSKRDLARFGVFPRR